MCQAQVRFHWQICISRRAWIHLRLVLSGCWRKMRYWLRTLRKSRWRGLIRHCKWRLTSHDWRLPCVFVVAIRIAVWPRDSLLISFCFFLSICILIHRFFHLLSFFNDIRSILDIQSHCVVMGASPLISTLFIHSHVTRYFVFWGEFSQECGRKATCQRRRSNEVEWVINVIPVVYIYSMQWYVK